MIGERVKAYRKELKLSLSEVANRAGVSKSYLSALERDLQSNPSIQFLEKIAAVLHITIDDLIHDKADQKDTHIEQLDADWQDLIKKAMDSGVSKEAFKDFIEFNMWRSIQKKK